MARPKGFEPLTPRFVVWCSIQLSYGRAVPGTAGARHRGGERAAQPSAGTLLLGGSFCPRMTDNGSLNTSLRRNIEALRRRRREDEAAADFEEQLASAITRFTGSMGFVYAHLLLYGFWIVANLGWVPGLNAWDPTFVILAMIASVEAIFLATFVLITQNRMAAAADRRAELDVQIGLLAEAEITKLVELVSEIARRMDVPAAEQSELEEMKRQVAPEAVLDAIEEEESAPAGD